MNEADSVFAKEGFLVEVPYVENSLVSPNVKSVIPRSHGIWTNQLKYDMCYMEYVMCYMQYGMCFVQYDTYDDACYSHGMTFLIDFGKSTDLTFHNSYR